MHKSKETSSNHCTDNVPGTGEKNLKRKSSSSSMKTGFRKYIYGLESDKSDDVLNGTKTDKNDDVLNGTKTDKNDTIATTSSSSDGFISLDSKEIAEDALKKINSDEVTNFEPFLAKAEIISKQKELCKIISEIPQEIFDDFRIFTQRKGRNVIRNILTETRINYSKSIKNKKYTTLVADLETRINNLENYKAIPVDRRMGRHMEASEDLIESHRLSKTLKDVDKIHASVKTFYDYVDAELKKLRPEQ